MIRAASWNVAAVNNNPFEYWITYPDDSYDSLMLRVEELMSNAEMDLPVHKIFTDDMFSELQCKMQESRIIGADKIETFWLCGFRERLAISGFLKDKTLGVKRLVSMPDRITNTIFLEGGGVHMRPTVINACQREG